MNEKNEGEDTPLTNTEHARNAMRALVILEKTANKMGGHIRPKITTKPSKYEIEGDGKAISVSLKLFFNPRLLREYIEQYPSQGGDNG
ncbi:MAG: hypothetical protein LBB48_08235 [Treponema sp.]|nr:hypothetical protein [Treponema sp.]